MAMIEEIRATATTKNRSGFIMVKTKQVEALLDYYDAVELHFYNDERPGETWEAVSRARKKLGGA